MNGFTIIYFRRLRTILNSNFKFLNQLEGSPFKTMFFSKRNFPKFRVSTNYILRISKTQTESDPGAQLRLCLENNNLYLSWILARYTIQKYTFVGIQRGIRRSGFLYLTKKFRTTVVTKGEGCGALQWRNSNEYEVNNKQNVIFACFTQTGCLTHQTSVQS